ncbi:transposase [Fulvivirgaceae bacterium BMA10]|uniref:Transposase n=1 Tax=Splendidivirga corallicola TaxID=3051826 RepID=A0ABT8KH32_9BACT|nr:transposase [Fulvivirgaceae bacterium BMA10]
MELNKEVKHGARKSRMFLNEVYFWTDTIKDWKHLLKQDQFKEIILNSWNFLVKKKKIVAYGFVIMPNHLHVIWEMLASNGREMPHASFNKFTSHMFLEELKVHNQNLLQEFISNNMADRNHRFWQRDPLAILMDSKAKIEQKLDYIHLNPLQEQWNLTKDPEDYKWSSAKYYASGVDDFRFLSHYKDKF